MSTSHDASAGNRRPSTPPSAPTAPATAHKGTPKTAKPSSRGLTPKDPKYNHQIVEEMDTFWCQISYKKFMKELVTVGGRSEGELDLSEEQLAEIGTPFSNLNEEFFKSKTEKDMYPILVSFHVTTNVAAHRQLTVATVRGLQ